MGPPIEPPNCHCLKGGFSLPCLLEVIEGVQALVAPEHEQAAWVVGPLLVMTLTTRPPSGRTRRWRWVVTLYSWMASAVNCWSSPRTTVVVVTAVVDDHRAAGAPAVAPPPTSVLVGS
jgi:hypothetical protein